MVDISSHGVSHCADSAVIYRRVAPGIVRKLGINGLSYHFYSQRSKLVHAVIQSNELGWADKGKIQGIKEHQTIFTGHRV